MFVNILDILNSNWLNYLISLSLSLSLLIMSLFYMNWALGSGISRPWSHWHWRTNDNTIGPSVIECDVNKWPCITTNHQPVCNSWSYISEIKTASHGTLSQILLPTPFTNYYLLRKWEFFKTEDMILFFLLLKQNVLGDPSLIGVILILFDCTWS